MALKNVICEAKYYFKLNLNQKVTCKTKNKIGNIYSDSINYSTGLTIFVEGLVRCVG